MTAAQDLAICAGRAIVADASVILAESVSIAQIVAVLPAIARIADAFSRRPASAMTVACHIIATLDLTAVASPTMGTNTASTIFRRGSVTAAVCWEHA